MRADDVLPDHLDQGNFNGVTIRKGTIAAFLANAKAWCDPSRPAAERDEARAHIAESVADLRAVGLFDVMAVRDVRLQALLDELGR